MTWTRGGHTQLGFTTIDIDADVSASRRLVQGLEGNLIGIIPPPAGAEPGT